MSELFAIPCAGGPGAFTAPYSSALRRLFSRTAQRVAGAERSAVQARFWLPAGAAFRVEAAQCKYLRIHAGCAWVTLGAGYIDLEADGPMGAHRAGDVFAGPGMSLRIVPGQRAVVEACGDQDLQFTWSADGTEGGRAGI